MSLGFHPMSKAFRTGSLVFAASLALAATSPARGDSKTKTRVTIRGSGSNVTIEESQASTRRPFVGGKAVSPDALGEAIRLKTAGASDGDVVAYLRVHQAELPPVVEAAAVTRLRRAGAGKAVVAYLTTAAAVDMGETGEGHGAAIEYAAAPEEEASEASSGYPFYGGYAAPYPARRRGSISSLRHAPVPRRHPLLGGSFPMRATHGRRPIE